MSLLMSIEKKQQEQSSLLHKRSFCCEQYLDSKNEDGKTALHLACMQSSTDNNYGVIESLLKYGANPFIVDSKGNTALHYLSSRLWSNPKSVHILLEKIFSLSKN